MRALYCAKCGQSESHLHAQSHDPRRLHRVHYGRAKRPYRVRQLIRFLSFLIVLSAGNDEKSIGCVVVLVRLFFIYNTTVFLESPVRIVRPTKTHMRTIYTTAAK